MSTTEVIEIPFERSSIARSLFEGVTFDMTFVEAFFEGRQAGRLFVDDPVRPTSAILFRTFDYFFAGAPAPGLRQFVVDAPAEAGVFDEIHDMPAARRTQTITFYGLVPMSDSWHAALLEDHGGALETIGRRSFRCEPETDTQTRGWRDRRPAGFRVVEVDAALAERIDSELGDVIGMLWGGYQQFGEGGFGACALRDDEIASVAYTSSVSSREINIGVETAPSFRRLGLASTVSLACMAMAFERGLVPTWDCDFDNPASAALAKKVGFTEFPSFVELAFPERRGPMMTHGLWSSKPSVDGVVWRRNSTG